MTTVRILLTIAALSMLLACATGCAAFNRSEYAVHTTVGQELIDLKKALDAGIITTAQYNEQVEDLLARRKQAKGTYVKVDQ